MENKSFVWVVTLSTNASAKGLFDEPEDGGTVEGVWSFSTFEKARAEMLKLIRAAAATSNGLFDGNGCIVGFQEYLENVDCPDETDDEEIDDGLPFSDGDYDDSPRSYWKARALPRLIQRWLMQKNGFTPSAIPEMSWTDYFIGCQASPEGITVTGVDDGPSNGIDPTIRINTFDMERPCGPGEFYQFCVDNTFSDSEPSYFFRAFLVQTEVDQKIGME